MNRKEIIESIKSDIERKHPTNTNTTQYEKLLLAFFKSLDNVSTELGIKTELYRYIDLIWLIDESTSESSKDDFSFLFKLRELLIEYYDNFIESQSLEYLDINKHYLFDKSEFFKIVEREKQNGFELLNRPISLNEYSEIPERREDFVGRQDKAKFIVEELIGNEKYSICISGQVLGDNGGIGKTTIAVQLAHFLSNKSLREDYGNPLGFSKDFHIYKNYFKDGVLWINISSTEKEVNNVISNIAQQIGYKYFPKVEFEDNQENNPEIDENKLEHNKKERAKDISENTNELQTYKKFKEKFKDLKDKSVLSKIELNQYEWMIKFEVESIRNEFDDNKIVLFEGEESVDTNVVRSLEEIALILNNKKTLVIIDNAEQNRIVFEYIFPRLNGFSNILITSRFKTPGIRNILIGNLNKSDSRALFFSGLQKGTDFQKDYFDNVYYSNIDKLCFEVLEGHPMSINLVAQCKNLDDLGLEDFISNLENEISSINHNNTYKKIYGLVKAGDILSDEEKEALIRGAANFEFSFTIEDISGFCMNHNYEKGLEGLYSKSIIRKEESSQSFIVQQVFKDYALDILKEKVTLFFGLEKNIQVSIEELLSNLKNKIAEIDLLKELSIPLNQRYKISNDLISFSLAFMPENSSIILKKCKEYTFLLNEETGETMGKCLSASKVFQRYNQLREDEFWYKYIEVYCYIAQGRIEESFKIGSRYLRLFYLNRKRYSAQSLGNSISNLYSHLKIDLKSDFVATGFSNKIKQNNYEDIYVNFQNLLDCYTDNEKKSKLLIQLTDEKFITKFRSPSLYSSILLKKIIHDLKLENRKLKLSRLKPTLNSLLELNLINREDISYIELLVCFKNQDYSFIASTDKLIFQSTYYIKEFIALKALSLSYSNSNEKSIAFLNEYLKKSENFKLDKLYIFHCLNNYIPYEEAIRLLNFSELQRLSENKKLNNNFPTKMKLIPEGKTFIESEDRIVIDEDYLAENALRLFDESFNQQFKDKDLGVIIYPFLIDEIPVSKEIYKAYCIETNKDFIENEFNINDALEFAKNRGLKVASNEEWVKAFTSYNYNLNYSESLYKEHSENKKYLITCQKATFIQESSRINPILKFVLPNSLFQFYKEDKAFDKELIEELINSVTFCKQEDCLDIPVELVRVIAYSPSINSPKLKHHLIKNIISFDLDKRLKTYKLLLNDFMIYLNSTKNDKEILLELISQRNQWKIALKLILGLQKYFESLKFTNTVELIHEIREGKDIGVYKKASKNAFKFNEKPQKGFTPFRCVKPLPLQFELLNKMKKDVI